MDNLKLYHYDNTEYFEGEFINKNNYFSPEVVKAYSLEIGMDPRKITYMLDHEDEEYEEIYNYCYEIEPLGRVKKVMMDFSPIMCQDYLDRINKNFNRQKVAEMFAKWYNGEKQDKIVLDLLNIPQSNKIEYITDKPLMIKEKTNCYYDKFENELNSFINEMVKV